MKRMLTLFAVLGLVAYGSSAAHAMLANGDLNALDPANTWQFGPTPSSWSVDATRGGPAFYLDAMESAGFADRTGGGSGLFFKAFTGNPPWDPAAGSVDGSLFQDVPGTPGMKYILTGWAAAESNYSGLVTPGPNSFIGLDFLDGLGGVISSLDNDLEANGLAVNPRDAAAGGPWNWTQYMVMGVAPAGTATVRSRVTMLDGVFNTDPGQAFIADDFELRCVPEPASLALVGLAIASLVGIRRRSK